MVYKKTDVTNYTDELPYQKKRRFKAHATNDYGRDAMVSKPFGMLEEVSFFLEHVIYSASGCHCGSACR